MRRQPILEAFIAATLAPGLVTAALAAESVAQAAWTFALVSIVAVVHTLVLGVPLYFWLRWRGWVNAFTAILGGAIVATIPYALLSWPLWDTSSGSSAWIGGSQTVADGLPTLEGWRMYRQGIFMFTPFGALGGAVFWCYLYLARRLSPNSSMQPTGQERPAAD